MSLGKFEARLLPSADNSFMFEVLPEFGYASNWCKEQMKSLIEKGKDIFTITVDRQVNSRTLKQNKLMWALLEIMAYTENAGRTGGKGIGVDSYDCYIEMIEQFGASYDYMMCLPEAFQNFKEKFRALKIMEQREYGGKTMLVIKCFHGSSKFNTVQMGLLIDGIFDRLAEMGVDATNKSELDYLSQQWRELNGRKTDV